MISIKPRTSAFSLLLLVLSGMAGSLPAARPVRINLGTIAPSGSSAHKALLSMREKWRDASKGEVKFVIYPDGTQGGEGDMVRLMRVGMLQAGLFTGVGLSEIEPGVAALQNMPLMFRNLEEFDYVSGILRPKLEKRLENKGFAVLFWVNAGWVRFFTKEPLRRPEELKKMKFFVWEGETVQANILRRAGFNPVILETAEIIPGLQTGLINAVAVPPIFALAGQLDLRAPYMLNLNYAPLVGAAIIKKTIWEKIPFATRLKLKGAARAAGREINATARREGGEAVAAMRKRGLQVTSVSREMEGEWRETAEGIYPRIRGALVPAEVFDEVRVLLKAYRARDGVKPQ